MTKPATKEAPYETLFETPFYSLAYRPKDENDEKSSESWRLDINASGKITMHGNSRVGLMRGIINFYVSCLSINESTINNVATTIMGDVCETASDLELDNSNAPDLETGDTLGNMFYAARNFFYTEKLKQLECLLSINFGAKDHPASVEFTQRIQWHNDDELARAVIDAVGRMARTFTQYRAMLWMIFTTVSGVVNVPFNFQPAPSLYVSSDIVPGAKLSDLIQLSPAIKPNNA